MKYRPLLCVLGTSLFVILNGVSAVAMNPSEDSRKALVQSTSIFLTTPQSINNQQLTAGIPILLDGEPSQVTARFYLRQITLQGAKFLGRAAKKRLLQPYLHQLVDATQINQLAQAIRAYYIAQGYPTTQVKVRLGQNLQAGELSIDIQLGFIEDIILNGHTARDKGKVATAFLWFKGRPLYLPYLDQGIDQLNSIPSSRATLKILPGLQEGGSLVLIDQVVSKPLRLDIGGDNLGKAQTGPWRWKYHLDIDNLLSMNDSWSAHYDINHAKKKQDKHLRAHYLLLKLSFPIGYLSFATSHHIGSSITLAGGNQFSPLFTQQSYAQAYEIKCPLYKHRGNKGTISASLHHSRATNLVRDVVIDTQSKPETQGKLEVSHTGVIYQGVYAFSFAYEQGLTWLGAEVDKKQPPPGVRASDMSKRQFKKLNFHGRWNRPFILFKRSFHYQLHWAGQYSKDEIVGTHQLPLTGASQVRGFTDSYTGNKGIYCQQELSWKHLFPFFKWLYPLNVNLGLDIGYLPQLSNTDPQNTSLALVLASFILGCQYHVDWLDIDCTYAQPFYRNQAWGKLQDKGKVYVSCNVHVHELLSILS